MAMDPTERQADLAALYFRCPHDQRLPADCQLAEHRTWDFRRFSDWIESLPPAEAERLLAEHAHCLQRREAAAGDRARTSSQRLRELAAAIEAARASNDQVRVAALTMQYADLASQG